MKPATAIALGGRYRLVSRIAVGGMGEVWVGHDEALARDVAVKVLREEFAGDAGFLERFRTEARNSAQLSHPNIAQLYDYGEQDGSGFLVMELVLGEPMSDLLDRQPVLPTRRLLPILAQTARALHAAHVASVVHRDVKPGNILLARSGRVKITDFGISTATNQVPMTASGMVMGTAQYLSPEQAIGRAATPASDIYSLGIVAYEALIGNRPFTGPTAVDIAVAHVNKPVPPLPDDIDPELSALVMRMLSKEPEERPRSAASLARTLDAMLDRTPPGGVPTPYGRHARTVDLMDAAELAGTAPRSTGFVPRPGNGSGPLVPAVRDETVGARTDSGPVAPPTPPAAGSAAAGSGPVVVPGRPVENVLSGPVPPVIAPDDQPNAGGDGARTADARPTGPQGPGVQVSGVQVPGPQAPVPHDAAAPPERPGPQTGLVPSDAVVGPQPIRTSTTTGQRWGTASRPLVVLVLMVVFALLGAAFADRVWGREQSLDGRDGMAPGTSQAASLTDAPGRGTLPLRRLVGAAGHPTQPRDQIDPRIDPHAKHQTHSNLTPDGLPTTARNV